MDRRSGVLYSLGTMLEQVHRTAMQQTQVSLEVKTSFITSMWGCAAIHWVTTARLFQASPPVVSGFLRFLREEAHMSLEKILPLMVISIIFKVSDKLSFSFAVENGAGPDETQLETPKSDLNLITLERNSYNFLE
jgi:hypothetical protein